ncbi:transmembrane amino acid transporter protein-domain-containing protein [Boeremia exigua]|uniref:transmembrane amino acid transporter protein-domain-containing protein n=1 Tax=Boeremia exigua TaxID=749465 RepID=UPI001E8E416F|nr:transmembrane amino acid transporter protein-domain-containing protein [Boeremia exigua]KAH6616711.1 transmembrane amino acid transporter protein-domain-containing protein [Boeremia exigua]
MGLKNPFQKKEAQGSPAQSETSPYPGSEKSNYDEEFGQNTNITTGWTGDGFAGANEYPQQRDGLGDEYRTLGRWRACVILITIEVGIGVLSLPSALQTLGLIPGIIAILGFGSLTTYCGYIMVQFYRKYPMVTNLVDCALYLGGKNFERFFGVAFIFNLVLICASANITMSIALNTLSSHAICTVAFIAIPHVACWLLCLPRKLTFAAAMSWICTISIVASVLIVMIALGVAGPKAPPGFDVKIILVGKPTFVETVNALLNVAFAFAGNQSFMSVMAEMRNPQKEFPPALFMQKSFEVVVYIVVACVIYGLAGDAVTSPALGSAPTIPAKIAYGILIPSVLGTGLVIGITAIKYMYIAIMRKVRPEQVNIHNAFTWTLWVTLGTLFWIVSFVISNAIPIFSSILNISSAIFISWFTFGLTSVMWLHLNWKQQWSTPRKSALACLNYAILLMTLFLNVGGLYTSLKALIDIFNDPNSTLNGPFTCSDNSIF